MSNTDSNADPDAGQGKRTKRSSRLLIDEEPLQVLPTLAVAAGINEAILLQQTHYWLKIAQKADDRRKFFGKRWWTYNRYEDWQKQMPWLSVRTIRSLIHKLEEMGVLLSIKRHAKRRDHTKWYSLDYEELEALYTPSDVAENDTLNQDSNVAENDTSNRQNVTHPDVAENDTSYTESPESPSENTLPESTDSVEVEEVKGRERTSKGKIKALTNEEAEALLEHDLAGDPLKERVMRLVQLGASKNKSGEMAMSRAYSEFVEPYVTARDANGVTLEAWQYAFEETLKRQIPNVSYAIKTARGYAEREPSSKGTPDISSSDNGKSRRMEGYEWLFGEEEEVAV
jgi:hypothetical protein